MIEVALELKLDSFLVRSTAESGGATGSPSAKALRLSCAKVASVRKLTDSTPTSDFEFLGSANKVAVVSGESDEDFDERLFQYLKAHSTVDISKVGIASGDSGYSATGKPEGGSQMGRMLLSEISGQSSVVLELVLKPDEFEAVWELTTKNAIRQVFATLVCFKLKQTTDDKAALVAGVLSSSLRMMPES
jgi:hypothetical protein